MPITFYPDGGRPNGNERLNAPGSLYPSIAPTAADVRVTSLLEEQIYSTIFNTVPKTYSASLEVLMFDREPTWFVGTDEASWYEMPDNRMAITVDNGVAASGTQLTAAQTPATGAFSTANIPVSDADFSRIGLNRRLHFRSGGWASVVGKTAGTPSTIQVSSLAGTTLPAIVQGDVITVGAEIRADGEKRIVNNMRAEALKRTNFIATIFNAIEYGYKERLKLQNANTTDFLEQERMEIVRNTVFDAICEVWNGNKNAQQQDSGSGGKYAKGTDGVKTQMINAGVIPVTTTVANMVATHEALNFATNKQSGVVYNIATERLLYEFSKAYKENLVRYTPNDRVADLNLKSVQIGTREHVLVPAEIFGDPNYLPGWDGHYFMLDRASIKMAGMQGMPYIDMGGMMKKRLQNFRSSENPPNADDTTTWTTEMTFAPMMIDPLKSALMIVQ